MVLHARLWNAADFIEFALCFELFAHGFLQEVLKGELKKSPRPYKLDDIELLVEILESLLHDYLPLLLLAADESFWQKLVDAKLFEARAVGGSQRNCGRLEKL